MLFSLKFQRNDQQNTLAKDSVNGKPDKKAVFSSCCGDEATICYDRALLKQFIAVFLSVLYLKGCVIRNG